MSRSLPKGQKTNESCPVFLGARVATGEGQSRARTDQDSDNDTTIERTAPLMLFFQVLGFGSSLYPHTGQGYQDQRLFDCFIRFCP